jgi:hypothetical protein
MRTMRFAIGVIALLVAESAAFGVPAAPRTPVSTARTPSVQMGRMPISTTRPRVPPPPAGAPPAFETFKRWTLVQLAADATSVTVLCLVTVRAPGALLAQRRPTGRRYLSTG